MSRYPGYPMPQTHLNPARTLAHRFVSYQEDSDDEDAYEEEEGLFDMGGDRAQCAFAVALIVAPVLGHWIYLAPQLAIISGFSCDWFRFPCTALAVTALCLMASLVKSDPGVIPRRPEPLTHQMDKEEYMGDEKIVRKWCVTCFVHRSPRGKHCRTCDHCVRRFDHHCPWIMNCVGINNHRRFITFIWVVLLCSMLMLCMAVFGLASYIAISLSEHPSPARLAAKTDMLLLVTVVYVLYASVVISFMGSLVSYHSVLLMRNMTTNEEMKDAYVDKKNPYDKGCFRNVYDFWRGRITDDA